MSAAKVTCEGLKQPSISKHVVKAVQTEKQGQLFWFDLDKIFIIAE